jgi:hypothetical protein
MNMEDSLSRDECLGSIPNAFLSFVHDDHFWAFAPEKFMRWRPSRVHPVESDRWEPFPYVWDFGARVVVPEHWLTWLSAIVGRRSSKNYRPLNPIGVKMDATLVFEDVMRYGERKLIVVQPQHPFRGEDLVVVMGAPFVRLWNLSVGIVPQFKPNKDADGRDTPWLSSQSFKGDIPVNLRFDTCLPKQNISLDVEVGPPASPAGIGGKNLHSDFEVRIELRGTELVEREDDRLERGLTKKDT